MSNTQSSRAEFFRQARQSWRRPVLFTDEEIRRRNQENVENDESHNSASNDNVTNEMETLHLQPPTMQLPTRSSNSLSDIDQSSIASGVENALHERNFNQIYSSFNFSCEKKSTVTLPIEKYREDIVEEIAKSRVTILRGHTGSGKSTFVPQFILDEAQKCSEPVNIVVTQPRRIAARSIAQRICDIRGWRMGDIVGYQVGLEKRISNSTLLQFVTTGVLLKRLISANQSVAVATYTHIFLDEIHERDTEMDLLLQFLRESIQHNCKTKIILMSATLQIDKLRNYFQLYVTDIVDVPEAIHNVKEHYLDDMVKGLGLLSNQQLTKLIVEQGQTKDEIVDSDNDCQMDDNFINAKKTPTISKESKELLYRILCYLHVREFKDQKPSCLDDISCGSVLIFIPGLYEILDIRDFLKRANPERRFPCDIIDKESKDKKFSDRWQFVLLHSQVKPEDQDQVFRPPHKGHRKVILATNIAESSITVSDVKYVIDFGMSKHLDFIPENTFSSLCTVWASQSSCKQRRGRAGRVTDGEYFSIMKKHFYNNLPTEDKPEMLRAPLEQTILKIKEANRHPIMVLKQVIDPPEIKDIKHGICKLVTCGAVVVNRIINPSNTCNQRVLCPIVDEDLDTGGELSFMGQIMCQLPLDIHASKLIGLGHIFGILEQCVVMAACMTSTRNIFISHLNLLTKNRLNRNNSSDAQAFEEAECLRKLEVYQNKLSFTGGTQSDSIACLQAFCLWLNQKQTGASTGAKMKEWCRYRSLDSKALEEVYLKVQEIIDRLKQPPLNIDVNLRKISQEYSNMKNLSGFDLFLIQFAICGAFYPNYFIRKYQPDLEENAEREFLHQKPQQCVVIHGLPQKRGGIYKDEIAAWFSKMCFPKRESFTAYEPHCEIIPYESHAIVKFSEPLTKKRSIVNGALMPVYLAMQLNRNGRLRTNVREICESTGLISTANQYETLLSRYSPEIVNIDVPSAFLKNHIGLPNDAMKTIDVIITHIEDVGIVYGVYEKQWNRVKKMQNKLNSIEWNCQMKVKLARKDKLYAVKVKQEEKTLFYRGRIMDTKDNEIKSREIGIFLVDSGDKLMCKIDDLFEIDDCEIQMEKDSVVRLVLAELQPNVIDHPDGKWNGNDRKAFEEKVHLLDCFTCEVYSRYGFDLRVFMKPKYSRNPQTINQFLISNNNAEFIQEPSLSRDNHHRKLDPYDRNPSIVNPFIDEGFLKHNADWLNLNEKIKEEIQNVRKKDKTLNIRGPNHPYLMEFIGITSSCVGKSANVANDSVCSVLIDDHPSAHTDRLLVAGIVHRNFRRDENLTLRQATLMPHIPGLPLLVSMIFAPYAEMRVDQPNNYLRSQETVSLSKGFTRYSGALCGVGYTTTGKTINQGDNLEMRADVLIDKTDLELINNIRSAISLILKRNSIDQLLFTSKREYILEYIEKLFLAEARSYINPECAYESYKWLQLPPECFYLGYRNVGKCTRLNFVYLPIYHVVNIPRDTYKYIKDSRKEENASEEIVDWHKRYLFMQRMRLRDFESINNTLVTRSRANNSLGSAVICEICPSGPLRHGFVCKNREDVRKHLDDSVHISQSQQLKITN